eukprot:gene14833-20885_t
MAYLEKHVRPKNGFPWLKPPAKPVTPKSVDSLVLEGPGRHNSATGSFHGQLSNRSSFVGVGLNKHASQLKNASGAGLSGQHSQRHSATGAGLNGQHSQRNSASGAGLNGQHSDRNSNSGTGLNGQNSNRISNSAAGQHEAGSRHSSAAGGAGSGRGGVSGYAHAVPAGLQHVPSPPPVKYRANLHQRHPYQYYPDNSGLASLQTSRPVVNQAPAAAATQRPISPPSAGFSSQLGHTPPLLSPSPLQTDRVGSTMEDSSRDGSPAAEASSRPEPVPPSRTLSAKPARS